MLCEVVLIKNPTKKESEDGKLEEIIFGPKLVVAKDTAAAGLKTVLENAAALKDVDMSSVGVLVRPFN